MAKVFFIISTAFLLSWLPMVYITTATNVLNLFELVPHALLTVSLFTTATSSLVNPLVYAFLKPDFKAIIRNFCRKSSAVEAVSTKPIVPTPPRQAGTEENMKQRDQTKEEPENNSAKVKYDTYL